MRSSYKLEKVFQFSATLPAAWMGESYLLCMEVRPNTRITLLTRSRLLHQDSSLLVEIPWKAGTDALGQCRNHLASAWLETLVSIPFRTVYKHEVCNQAATATGEARWPQSPTQLQVTIGSEEALATCLPEGSAKPNAAKNQLSRHSSASCCKTRPFVGGFQTLLAKNKRACTCHHALLTKALGHNQRKQSHELMAAKPAT